MYENNENEEVVEVNIDDKNINKLKSYGSSEEYPKKLREEIKRLEGKLNKLNNVQRTISNRENPNYPSNEFINRRRLIQGKIYGIEDKIGKIDQELSKLRQNKEKNTIATFGRMGELPIKRGPIGTNNEELLKEEKHENNLLKRIGSAKQFPERGILAPITGQKRERQTTLPEFYTNKTMKRQKTNSSSGPNISMLTITSEGGKRKTTKNKQKRGRKYKHLQTMKKRK